jgi:hypothetical protein
MAWPTTPDGLWYIFDGQVLMPISPETGAPVLYLRPNGGVGQAIPAVAQGDPGKHAELDTTINYTELAYNDPTAASASFTTITPPTDSTPGVYRLNVALHAGSPGADGTTTLTTGSVTGTPVYKKIPQINSAGTGFEYTTQKVGGRHYPASINNTGTGNSNSTLAVVSITAGTYDFDYRVEVEAQTIVTGTGANVSVDLVARLNGETSGNDIGRCFGTGGTKDRLIIAGGYAAGNADGWDKITAGSGCTVHLRTEQVSGSDTYTTSNTTTRFVVKVRPVL